MKDEDIGYVAKGNQVFVNGELFLTVHPTEPTTLNPPLMTVERHAELLAEMLNDAT